MPSQRNKLSRNKNGSKNTRMDFSKLSDSMDYRKDEIMHIGRYSNGANTMVKMAKGIGRPVKVLDVGCGEMNTVRLFYKSILEKKRDIVSEYVGIDIDYIMVEKAIEKYGNAYQKCNARFLVQDLTENPRTDFPDEYFDLAISFEFLEHIQPRFAMPILDEIYRVLRHGGVALISTPNSNGSQKSLPEDHIYEYSYQELIEMFLQAGFVVEKAVGTSINISRIPDEEKRERRDEIDRVYTAFGENSNFSSVALAPLFNPENCKNVLYRLTKQ